MTVDTEDDQAISDEENTRIPQFQANVLDWILNVLLRALGLKSLLAYCFGPTAEGDDPFYDTDGKGNQISQTRRKPWRFTRN